MRVAIGSTNQVKVMALQQVLSEYAGFQEAEVLSVEVPSGVSDQPLSLEEIIRGAKNRASSAYRALWGCQWAVGIESGLMLAPGTLTGYLETCISAVYDGEFYHTGMSCGFEIPPHVLKAVLEEKMDLSQACYHTKVTTNQKLGSAEGIIGIVTKGRIDRGQYTRQSLITALAQLEHAHWYRPMS